MTIPDEQDGARVTRWAWGALFLIAFGLLALPWTGHLDDSDAQVYRVVVRHLVRDHSWLQPTYLPDVHPRFREHLPFGFWPSALATLALGEHAADVMGALYALLTLTVVAGLARKWAGDVAGVLAVLFLAFDEPFFSLSGTPRLDPLLVLLTTLSAGLVLQGPVTRLRWGLATAFAALGALVKGPFGLLPLACAYAARAASERRLSHLFVGCISTLAAAFPAALFLLYNHWRGDGTWWEGYVHAQLLASALGARTDGKLGVWVPFVTLWHRFWPGLPFALYAALSAFTARLHGRGPTIHTTEPLSNPAQVILAARTLTMVCLLMLAGLCLPSRKVWNHTLVVFPFLAVLAGMGARQLLGKVARADSTAVRLGQGIIALAVVVVLAFTLRAGRYIWTPRCAASGPLAPILSQIASGTPIQIVSVEPEWRTIASLAAERSLVPSPSTKLAKPGARFDWALVSPPLFESGTGWQVAAVAPDWLLLRAANSVSSPSPNGGVNRNETPRCASLPNPR
jgi:4-amino-4-deoxy-L-arabinose transferase-like glycosyltransferase